MSAQGHAHEGGPQPAMGIAQQGTDQVGFPAGALVFDATFMMNATPMSVRCA